MPKYDFECQACRKAFDLQTSVAAYTALLREKKICCPECDSKYVTRVFSPTAVLTSSSRTQPRTGGGGCCCRGGECG
jgi:putative FmdB family regulatory protein